MLSYVYFFYFKLLVYFIEIYPKKYKTPIMANPAKYILQKLRLAKNRTKPVGIMSDKFAKLPKKVLAQGISAVINP